MFLLHQQSYFILTRLLLTQQLTAHARTGRVEVDKSLTESTSIEQIDSKLVEPQDEKNGEKDDVSKRQRCQVVTGATQFARLGSYEHEKVICIAQYSQNDYRTKVISIEPFKNFE